MSKSIKPKNNEYVDTKGIMHKRKVLDEIITNLYKIYSLWPTSSNKTINTDISINAGQGGKALLALVSGHSSDGNATYASLWLIRFGYSNNNMSSTKVATLSGTGATDSLSFGYDENGKLTITTTWSSGFFRVLILNN